MSLLRVFFSLMRPGARVALGLIRRNPRQFGLRMCAPVVKPNPFSSARTSHPAYTSPHHHPGWHCFNRITFHPTRPKDGRINPSTRSTKSVLPFAQPKESKLRPLINEYPCDGSGYAVLLYVNPYGYACVNAPELIARILWRLDR